MGTNYYLCPIIKEEELKKLFNSLKECKTLYELKNSIHEITDYKKDRIHIGKSSYGWQFLFNLNIESYVPTISRDNIDKWLATGIIFDEYDNKIDRKDFWKIVDGKKDLLDSEAYNKTQSKSIFIKDEDQHINGLRFTISKYEFS